MVAIVVGGGAILVVTRTAPVEVACPEWPVPLRDDETLWAVKVKPAGVNGGRGMPLSLLAGDESEKW